MEVLGDKAPSDERSCTVGVHDVPRVSSAMQTFATEHVTPDHAPLNMPLNKTTALGQATGDWGGGDSRSVSLDGWVGNYY